MWHEVCTSCMRHDESFQQEKLPNQSTPKIVNVVDF